MRLGVVLKGTGALAAAGVGVLEELNARGIEPDAVCGMQAGAWPAAMYMAGRDIEDMEKALRETALMGKRIFRPAGGAASLLRGKRAAMIDARRLEHLLAAQTTQRMLCLCRRAGILLCRTAGSGRKVIFSSYVFAQDEHAMLSMQASVAFAARAAMALPPFLAPTQWMGSLLLAEYDTAFACSQLLAMGMQRVLIVHPVISSRRNPDALDLTGMAIERDADQLMREQASTLRIEIPENSGALSTDCVQEIAKAGRLCAQRQMDTLFEQMGMSFCRVLAFRPTGKSAGAR